MEIGKYEMEEGFVRRWWWWLLFGYGDDDGGDEVILLLFWEAENEMFMLLLWRWGRELSVCVIVMCGGMSFEKKSMSKSGGWNCVGGEEKLRWWWLWEL